MNEISQDTDIAVCTEKELFLPYKTGILLVDSSNLPSFVRQINVSAVVSCGMNEKDTVTFSSIDNDRAVLCVQRDIFYGQIALECGEFPVNYDSNLPVWHNVVLGFCEITAREL